MANHNDVLDVIETIDPAASSPGEVFRGEGSLLGRPRRDMSQYKSRLLEAGRLYQRVLHGDRRAMLDFQEAMSTSDFPLLFGDILQRQLAPRYRELPAIYTAFVKTGTVPDFRLVSRHSIDGAEGQLEQVNELAPYPAVGLEEQRDQFRVYKYGKRLPLSWETLVNDDLDAFRELPDRLARGARRTEQKFATQLYVGTTGPHGTLYSSGNANIVTGNPTLSVTALATALGVLSAQRDEDGEPIFLDVVTLVVPPALEITAQNILNALQIEMTDTGGSSSQKLIAANWMKSKFRLVVDPYIPIVASSSNGSTSWFLFASPTDGRAALEMGFLRGHTDPALFMKRPDAQRVGGTAGPDGDMASFDDDSVQYKVRHVLGGTRLVNTGGAKSTVASNGSGS